jgi:hypothetical protein
MTKYQFCANIVIPEYINACVILIYCKKTVYKSVEDAAVKRRNASELRLAYIKCTLVAVKKKVTQNIMRGVRRIKITRNILCTSYDPKRKPPDTQIEHDCLGHIVRHLISGFHRASLLSVTLLTN